jgi:hypothetical protein
MIGAGASHVATARRPCHLKTAVSDGPFGSAANVLRPRRRFRRGIWGMGGTGRAVGGWWVVGPGIALPVGPGPESRGRGHPLGGKAQTQHASLSTTFVPWCVPQGGPGKHPLLRRPARPGNSQPGARTSSRKGQVCSRLLAMHPLGGSTSPPAGGSATAQFPTFLHWVVAPENLINFRC